VFFRAEDGIRDRNVTGVQTCALPISWIMEFPAGPAVEKGAWGEGTAHADDGGRSCLMAHCSLRIFPSFSRRPLPWRSRPPGGQKIGRAACRERRGTIGGASHEATKRT